MKVKAKGGSESDSEMEADGVGGQREEKGKGEMKLVTDTELLARFYGDNDELDHNERFLRNYILNEGWKEK